MKILIQTGATESLGAALPVYVVLGILFIGAGSLSWVLAAPAIAEKTKQYILDPTKMLLLSRK